MGWKHEGHLVLASKESGNAKMLLGDACTRVICSDSGRGSSARPKNFLACSRVMLANFLLIPAVQPGCCSLMESTCA